MSVYKLRGAPTGGTENGLASLDIQFDGIITAMYGSLIADIDADLEFAQAEVSFLSQNSISNNDTRGSLFIMSLQIQAITAASVVPGHVNVAIPNVEIAVAAGERIFLHSECSAGVTGVIQAYLYCIDGAKVELRRRR